MSSLVTTVRRVTEDQSTIIVPRQVPAARGAAEPDPGVPNRPRSMDPQELGFIPQKPIGWLAPLLLLSTGLRTLLHILFGAYLDKRELQNSQVATTWPSTTSDLTSSAGSDRSTRSTRSREQRQPALSSARAKTRTPSS